MKIKTLKSDPSHRLPLEDIEQFFLNNKAHQSLPEIIQMQHIQKFTEKFTNVELDYFAWYAKQRPEFYRAAIFDCADLRAEQRLFSKTVGVFDQIYINMVISDIQHGNVPAYLNFQENITRDFLEETDRCYLFPISDNIVAALIGCLETNGLLNDEFGNIKDLPRLPAHIRRIIQFFVVPSQLYEGKPCDIEILMQKVFKSKFYSETYST